jgi:GDP-L-fucose synthase
MTELSDKRVWIAGQHGMVGSAMMRRLEREGCDLQRDSGRAGVDLRRQSKVEDCISSPASAGRRSNRRPRRRLVRQ